MRSEKLYLTDIANAINTINSAVTGLTEGQWLADSVRRDAVMYRLIVIGEAASHLSAKFRARHPDINWRSIIGFRNFSIHEYFSVDWDIVWDTIANDLPIVAAQVAQILRDEYGEEP
jgi:uncharacterized protein with HEPN domain